MGHRSPYTGLGNRFRYRAPYSTEYDRFNKIKLDLIIHSWKSRSLIPLVKNSSNSIFVYRLLALPNPNKELVQNIVGKIKELLWERKKAKTKYNKVIQRLEEEDLQLVDFEAKNHTLKITWVAKSVEGKRFWAKFAETFLPWTIPEIWNCNLSYKDIEKFYTKSL